MKQVQSGLFAVEKQMPCTPRDIKVWGNRLPNTFENAEKKNSAEMEEAAARIVSFSQQLDQWVGVSLERILEMLWNDFIKAQELREACKNEEIPFSLIHAFGPDAIRKGILELINIGMIMQVEEGKEVAFFPTPAFISCIMQKQSVIIS
jgi:hypothetical protein